jgi:hypothetical protein
MFNPVLFGTLSHVHLPRILSFYSYKNNYQHYDKDKFVLSGLRYEAILNCLDKEKGHKTEEGAKFKHWAKNNFRKTTKMYKTS